MHPHSLLLPFTPNSPWVLMQPQLASNACAPRLGTTVRGGLDSSRGGHSRQVATWHVKRDSDYCPKDHRLIQYRRSGILWPPRVSARNFFIENTNLLKKGICLLNTFLKDFTKIPIKKNTVLQFDGGGGGRGGSRIQKGGGFVHSEGGVSYRNFRSGSKLLQGPGQINKQKKIADSRRGGVRSPPKKTCIRAWGDIPPCQNHEGDKSPRPPSVWDPATTIFILL